MSRMGGWPKKRLYGQQFVQKRLQQMICTLLAALVVSFTFIPLIAYYQIRAPKHPEPPTSERRTHGFAGFYYRVGDFALAHRWGVVAGSLIVLVAGGFFLSMLKPQSSPGASARSVSASQSPSRPASAGSG